MGNPKTLSQALKDLEKESKESLSGQLENLKKAILELEPKVSAVAKTAMSESSDHVKKAKDEIEKRVGKNPLIAMGIIAILFLVVGWFLGSKKSSDNQES